MTDPFSATGPRPRDADPASEPFAPPSSRPASTASAESPFLTPTGRPSRNRRVLVSATIAFALVVGAVIFAVALNEAPSGDAPAPIAATTTTATTAALPPPPPPVEPGQVTVDDRLPAASPLPPGTLDIVDGRWLLGVYTLRSDVTVGDSTADEIGPNVVYLSSPDGDLYQVLELPRDVHWRVNFWDASTGEALFGKWDPDHTLFGDDPLPPEYVWVDLETGATRPADLGDVSAQFLNYEGTTADGRRLWLRSPQQPGEPALNGPQQLVAVGGDGTVDVLLEYDVGRYAANFSLSPDGTRVAAGSFSGGDTEIVTIATGEVATYSYDTAACADGSWLDNESLVSLCFTGDAGTTFSVARRDVATGELSEPLATGLSKKLSPLPLGYATSSGFLLDVTAPNFEGDACGVPQYLTDDGLAPLEIPPALVSDRVGYAPIGGAGGTTAFLIGNRCGDSSQDTRLISLDTMSGTYIERFPVARDTADAHVTLGFTSLARARVPSA